MFLAQSEFFHRHEFFFQNGSSYITVHTLCLFRLLVLMNCTLFWLLCWLQYKYPDKAKREVLNVMQQFTDLRPALNTHGESLLLL